MNRHDIMANIKLPIDRLSPEALQGVIDEFVSRSGTDYGITEVPLETKIQQVKGQLKSGHAVLVYDSVTKTCNILLVDDLEVRFS
jgi:uncharacterized protein YheU (UPF0270 family)